MNTTSLGDKLEKQIYALFKEEISNDRFWAKKKCCEVFRKKGYYSKDREKEIIFDVSVEIHFPGSSDYSLLMLIECKNYNHPVPVDDVEEFYAKIQQVAGVNVKGVLATTNAFQDGTLRYSKSKGLGLIRYFDKNNFKWVLKRSPSAGTGFNSAEDTNLVIDGLTDQTYRSDIFDLFCNTKSKATNSLWEFVEDLLVDDAIDQSDIDKIANLKSRLASHVEFLDKSRIESLSADPLANVSYPKREVPLKAICENESTRSGLSLTYLDAPDATNQQNEILGKIIFSPLKIHIYRNASANSGRERFTLAHELGHHFLNHARYMNSEFCEESDFDTPGKRIDKTDIGRMEWQANQFASCLLMPLKHVREDVWAQIKILNIPYTGHGALYVDNQPCNLTSFFQITDVLAKRYGVSRSVVIYRLEGLNLLHDDRREFLKFKSTKPRFR